MILVPAGDALGRRGLFALLLIVAAAWYVRAMDPHFATAYMDETVYVLYGRMFLSGRFEAPLDTPLQWSFGWYLWPAMAALADRLGGIIAVRELAAILGALTTLAVYGFARRVYSPAVGLTSAAVFAALAPAAFSFRIATRDAGAIFFFAVGLWLYARAWREQDASWLGAALSFFAAFLCKYIVAIYFPPLCLLALWKRWRAAACFVAPMAIACAAYGLHFRHDLAELLRYAHAYQSLQGTSAETWRVYFASRLDFWLLMALAAAGIWRVQAGRRSTALVLLAGAVIMPGFHIFSRADRDYWKHVTYALLFLVPLAMSAVIGWIHKPGRERTYTVVAVLAIAGSLSWVGGTWHIERLVFWPDLEPVLVFFDGRLRSHDRILVDDSALRYYLAPPLRTQHQIVDPYYFSYNGAQGGSAYRAAVRDGVFDFIVVGSYFREAQEMQAAIAPAIAERYVLRLNMPDRLLNWPLQVWERKDHVIRPIKGPRVEIAAPPSDSVIATTDLRARFEGRVAAAAAGSYVLVDVFTDRWYRQSGKVAPAVDGSFSMEIVLGGMGLQQCRHLVRARLFDARGHQLASAANFGIARMNPDGSTPTCR